MPEKRLGHESFYHFQKVLTIETVEPGIDFHFLKFWIRRDVLGNWRKQRRWQFAATEPTITKGLKEKVLEIHSKSRNLFFWARFQDPHHFAKQLNTLCILSAFRTHSRFQDFGTKQRTSRTETKQWNSKKRMCTLSSERVTTGD